MPPPAVTQLVVRALFAAIVLATVAAFLVAQRIKRGQPVVEKVRFTKYVSPNGDGIRDQARLAFRVKRTDRVDVALVDRYGDPVRTLATNRPLCGPCSHGFRWDGRTDDRLRAPDGAYRLRVTLRRQGRAITSPRKLFVDTEPPRPVVRSINPDSISPDGDGYADSALVRFEGPTGLESDGRGPRFAVYRLSRRGPLAVTGFAGRRGRTEARWRGRIAGRPAPGGEYLIVVRVRDVAGNLGRSPLRPPQRGKPRPHPELRVSYIEGSAPPGPVRAGRRAVFRVRVDRPAYRWTLRRLGARHPARRGRGRSSRLVLRAPRRPGRYWLVLRAGSHRHRTLFTVRQWKRSRQR